MRVSDVPFLNSVPDKQFNSLGREVFPEPGELQSDRIGFAEQLKAASEEHGFVFTDLTTDTFQTFIALPLGPDTSWSPVPDPQTKVCVPHLDSKGDMSVFLAAQETLPDRFVGISPIPLVGKAFLEHVRAFSKDLDAFDKAELRRIMRNFKEPRKRGDYLKSGKPRQGLVRSLFDMRDNDFELLNAAAGPDFVSCVQTTLRKNAWAAFLPMVARRIAVISSRVAHFRAGLSSASSQPNDLLVTDF